jgi:hypothetical protein
MATATGYEVPTVGGKSAYDIQREQVETQAEQDRKAREAALKRRVAAQNIEGSGIQESAQRGIEQTVGQERGAGLSSVNAQEAAAAQAAQTAATQQQYAKELQAGGIAGQQAVQAQSIAGQKELQSAQIASTEKITSSQLNLQEKQLAQQAGQFTDQLSFNKWATQQGFNEQDATRAWQSNENEKQLNQNAQQFYDQLSFNQWATEQGFSQQDAQRAWQSQENMAARTSAENISFAQLDMQGQQLAQQAMQFKDQLLFNQWATQQGFDQQDAQRAWQATQNEQAQAVQQNMQQLQLGSNEKIASDQQWLQQQGIDLQTAAQQGYTDRNGDHVPGSQELAVQAQQLAKDQMQQSLNIAREQIASNEKIASDQQWLQQQGIDLQTAAQQGYTDQNGNHIMGSNELAQQGLDTQKAQLFGYTDPSGQHVPGSLENNSITSQYSTAVFQANQQQEILGLQTTYQRGTINYQNELDKINKIDTTKAQNFFTLGQNALHDPSKGLSTQALTDMAQNDPLAYQAYSAGAQGQALADFNTQLQSTLQYRNAAITSLNPNSSTFVNNVKDIINQTGGQVAGINYSATGVAGSAPELKTPEQIQSVLSTSTDGAKSVYRSMSDSRSQTLYFMMTEPQIIAQFVNQGYSQADAKAGLNIWQQQHGLVSPG